MNTSRNQLQTWQWALLILNLIWSRWLFFPPETTQLWPSALPIAASPEAASVNSELWHVPASQVALLASVQNSPLFLTACGFSIFFAMLASRCPLLVSLPAIAFLSVIATPDQLPAALLAGMVSLLFNRSELPIRFAAAVQIVTAGWLITMLAIFFSLDFGLPLLMFLLLVCSQLARTGWKPRSAVMAVSLLAVVTISCWAVRPGFAAAAVRPILAFLTAQQSNVYPQLRPLWLTATGCLQMTAVVSLLVALFVMTRYRRAKVVSANSSPPVSEGKSTASYQPPASAPTLRQRRPNQSEWLTTALIFGILAMISGHNLLPCTTVLVCLVATCSQQQQTGMTSAKPTRMASWLRPAITAGLIAGLTVTTISAPGWSRVTGVPREVDLSLSGITGRVLLLQPSDSQSWDRLRSSGNVSLMADSRWDRPGLNLKLYETTCQDIIAGREDLELRPQRTMGGFRDFIQQHDVTVIAVHIGQLRTLRHLATNPKWQLTAMDCRKAIFETQHSSASITRSRRMADMLLHFEWPAAGRGFNPEGILELGDQTTVQSVARALSAMHMPLAALRCLQSSSSPSSDDIRREAYLELSIRVRDQCGCESLADAWRAFSDSGSSKATSNQNSATSAATTDAAKSAIRSRAASQPSAEEPELSVRQAILSGNSSALSEKLSLLSDSAMKNFYGQISRLTPSSSQLDHKALTSSQLPPRLQDEGSFILANLAVESGETQVAMQLLNEALSSFPHSPFNALRAFYLQQLSR